MSKNYFVTGSAGFIGFHLTHALLRAGHQVYGIDNFTPYYSPELKRARNQILLAHSNYHFNEMDLVNREAVAEIFKAQKFDTVFHLAAQAGVRYSIDSPETYLRFNIDATFNILEAVRHHSPDTHMMIASSSSVYGLSKNLPFSENDPADRPVALYGATKRSTELMAHSYTHLFGLKATLLRFFSVYGPWGRPDVALYKFVDQIERGETIEVYNQGDMIRDFTYVDDIVAGIVALDQARVLLPEMPFEIFNIGCSNPRTLKEFISEIEKCLGKTAQKKFLPFQPGDIYKSMADNTKIHSICGYQPKIQMEEGIKRFVGWYREYHGAQA